MGIPANILFDELLMINRLMLDELTTDIKKAYALSSELQMLLLKRHENGGPYRFPQEVHNTKSSYYF